MSSVIRLEGPPLRHVRPPNGQQPPTYQNVVQTGDRRQSRLQQIQLHQQQQQQQQQQHRMHLLQQQQIQQQQQQQQQQQRLHQQHQNSNISMPLNQPKYSMALNTSSTLNIQLMLEQNMSTMNIGIDPHSAQYPESQSPETHDNTNTPQPTQTNTTQPTQTNTLQPIQTTIPVKQTQRPVLAVAANRQPSQIIIQPEKKIPERDPSVESAASSGTSSMAINTVAEVHAPRTASPSISEGASSAMSEHAMSEHESDSARGSLGDVFSQDDSVSSARSDASWELSGHSYEAGTFDFTEPVLEPKPSEGSTPCLIAMAVGPGTALMLKMTCDNQKVLSDDKTQELLADITNVCWREIQRAKHELVNLSFDQLGKIRMSDGRLSGDHVTKCSKEVGGRLCLAGGVFRRFTDASCFHVANYLYEIVKTKGYCSIGKSGVVICVKKRNKYAPVEAFCEQLCEHIAQMKPQAVGRMKLADAGRTNPDTITSLEEQARRGWLLPQAFYFDQTILVAEAAKRSFVEIVDFAFFY